MFGFKIIIFIRLIQLAIAENKIAFYYLSTHLPTIINLRLGQ